MAWTREFLRWLGKPWPRDYLVFDIETQGRKRDWAVPTDIGHCLVRDCKVVSRGSFLLNWIGWPGIETDWLDYTMRKTAAAMARQGKSYPYTLERMRREGKPPERVLKFYFDLFTANRAAGAPFVGHNAIAFDCDMIRGVMEQACSLEWWFEDDEVYDCGAFEKAIQLNWLPAPEETTLRQFLRRVVYKPLKGFKWSLDVCLERYDLFRRHKLSPKQLHSAGMDAYGSYLLFEEHRKAA